MRRRLSLRASDCPKSKHGLRDHAFRPNRSRYDRTLELNARGQQWPPVLVQQIRSGCRIWRGRTTDPADLALVHARVNSLQ